MWFKADEIKFVFDKNVLCIERVLETEPVYEPYEMLGENASRVEVYHEIE